MINQSTYYCLRPDAPREMRIFGDEVSGIIKNNSVFPRELLEFGVENFSGVQPGLQTPSLVSSFEGSIDRILFCFPVGRTPAQIAVYKSLIRALGPTTKLIVSYNESMRVEIESWLNAINHPLNNVEWAPIPDYVGLSHWAEDAYVALKDANDGQSYLMEPWSFLRGGDQLIADAVDDYTDVNSSQAPLKFQGGNCLIGDDFWILGADYFHESVEKVKNRELPLYPNNNQSVEDVVNECFKNYVDSGRKLFLAGTNKKIPLRQFTATENNGDFFIDIAAKGVGDYQPIFHIDMFVTLLGRNANGEFEILVADPEAGNQLIGATNESVNLQSTYDKIAKDFRNSGFVVHRNPIIHHSSVHNGKYSVADLAALGDPELTRLSQEFKSLGAQDTDIPTVRDWHHITWNNCLIENSANKGKQVYLPTFGHNDMRHLSVVDDAMEAQFQNLGFTVNRLEDCNELAEAMGVVHCISKYVDRGT